MNEDWKIGSEGGDCQGDQSIFGGVEYVWEFLGRDAGRD